MIYTLELRVLGDAKQTSAHVSGSNCTAGQVLTVFGTCTIRYEESLIVLVACTDRSWYHHYPPLSKSHCSADRLLNVTSISAIRL
jgi:hypothetical protein